jgi:lipoate-protein ligase B
MHGFALNVNADLSKFDRIIPCGIFHKGVTSMQRTLGQEVSIDSVQKAIVESFADVFGCEPNWIEKDKLDATITTVTTRQQRADELSRSIVTD